MVPANRFGAYHQACRLAKRTNTTDKGTTFEASGPLFPDQRRHCSRQGLSDPPFLKGFSWLYSCNKGLPVSWSCAAGEDNDQPAGGALQPPRRMRNRERTTSRRQGARCSRLCACVEKDDDQPAGGALQPPPRMRSRERTTSYRQGAPCSYLRVCALPPRMRSRKRTKSPVGVALQLPPRMRSRKRTKSPVGVALQLPPRMWSKDRTTSRRQGAPCSCRRACGEEDKEPPAGGALQPPPRMRKEDNEPPEGGALQLPPRMRSRAGARTTSPVVHSGRGACAAAAAGFPAKFLLSPGGRAERPAAMAEAGVAEPCLDRVGAAGQEQRHLEAVAMAARGAVETARDPQVAAEEAAEAETRPSVPGPEGTGETAPASREPPDDDPDPGPPGRASGRCSWRRSSLKGTYRRRSLPPFHQGITDLSQAIDKEMAADKRLGRLLLSSFQFSVLQVEPLLKQMDGFDLDSFRAKAASVTEEFARYTERLERDGTLQRCCEPRPGSSPNSGMEAAVGEMKDYITRFSSECRAWDQLLLHYEDTAKEVSRPREDAQVAADQVDPAWYLETSQSEVLSSKPDYGQIVSGQGQVFDCMELVMDELQVSMRQLKAFMDDSTRLLQKMSGRLGSRTFRRLDNSPARKLLKSQPPKTPG
ncbi:kinetochore-associated protein DSN1 homolog [Tachyglossus aculeatus]|uniref:kinetochore-associated protein DSN1 homolog n=1 Tax=Tachyglossus aculeatus TaxID=9261 RepID=UPI0018F6AE2C|nr:kinetochore-associated protein DSN1 homolog [Tachyglossus aculeatus]